MELRLDLADLKLVMGAEVDFEQLYVPGHNMGPFERTLTQMQEMQSDWYWQV